MYKDHKSLQELLNDLQSLQNAQAENTGKLRRKLEWLEARRKEFFNAVSQTSSDFESRRKLEDTEGLLEEARQQLAQSELEMREALREVREQILELRNEELEKLEQEARNARQRRDEVHSTLLPAAQARVAALLEEERRLGLRNEEIARRIRDLNEMDFRTSQVA